MLTSIQLALKSIEAIETDLSDLDESGFRRGSASALELRRGSAALLSSDINIRGQPYMRKALQAGQAFICEMFA